MQYLGIVTDITKRGHLLIRAQGTPSLGARVCDKQMKVIGAIKRVFGPVASPYVTVAPNSKRDLSLRIIGTELYIETK